ncbi:MAG TPA: hypothetical protein PKE66_04710 [Pyrinomonadaceae bacterium]|nr:hypothetical protein [Pyrinomonadaceae bacterium]
MSIFDRNKTSGLKFVYPDRCEIVSYASIRELESLVEDPNVKTIQFVKPLETADFQNLERIIFSKRKDICLRAYGHYSSICDLSFLEHVPSVRRFSADALMTISNIDAVTEIKDLEELWVDVYDLLNFDFLDRLPLTLRTLGLGETSSRRPSIGAISRFDRLTYLYLEKQQKGIESIRSLKHLEKIVLRSISTKDVEYLLGLNELWSVDVKLGGIKDFKALSALPKLKYLELWMVRGLRDLSFISSITSLQHLFLQSLKQVTELPDLSQLKQLRRVYLEDLKGLVDLTSLEFAPALYEFAYTMAQNQAVENLLPVLLNPNTKAVGCWFGSDKKNRRFEQLLKEYGKENYTSSEFQYI